MLAVWFWQHGQSMLGEDPTVDQEWRWATKMRFAAVGQQEARQPLGARSSFWLRRLLERGTMLYSTNPDIPQPLPRRPSVCAAFLAFAVVPSLSFVVSCAALVKGRYENFRGSGWGQGMGCLDSNQPPPLESSRLTILGPACPQSRPAEHIGPDRGCMGWRHAQILRAISLSLFAAGKILSLLLSPTKKHTKFICIMQSTMSFVETLCPSRSFLPTVPLVGNPYLSTQGLTPWTILERLHLWVGNASWAAAEV